jgi:hypothetical protein
VISDAVGVFWVPWVLWALFGSWVFRTIVLASEPATAAEVARVVREDMMSRLCAERRIN